MAMLNNPRCIGRVRHVRGATVTVALDPELAGVTPLWEGQLHLVGQVGSLVQIPQGPVKLLATVSLVGIAELSGTLEPSVAPQVGERWIQVQLLGEVDGLGRFQRGVSIYPGLDDAVEFITAPDLRAIFLPPSNDQVSLGTVSSTPDVEFTLAAQKLVTRHGAIVGSTGSGKTSAVASLLQSFTKNGLEAANIVVVDPHGEYTAAMKEVASVRSVLGNGASLLRVPYWALPAEQILRALVRGSPSPSTINRFVQLVTDERRKFAKSSKWLKIESSAVTADSPVPFDLRAVWFQLDYENCATFEQQGGKGAAQVETKGDAQKLQPTVFKHYGLGSQAPFKGTSHGLFGTAPDQLRNRISDPQYRFFLTPDVQECQEGPDPLVPVIQAWLGEEKPVSVLDFSGVPSDTTDLAIGVVLDLLFELATRSKTDGIGRPRPVLVVLEEAHRYLGDYGTVELARNAANRIAREGRKYGIGLLLITQRPSELPATALSQVGTIIALRLTNGTDQATVKAALPDNVTGLGDALPALRTGEAVVVGEAVTLPARIQIRKPTPAPDAQDPSLDSWRGAGRNNEISNAVARWRGLPEEEKH